ncbi:MAG: cation:proton antiporter, partial [Ktedonobacteraceae bacterium]|nr:cation:proton antiporter [Ktedonobacteraceae bacterium]
AIVSAIVILVRMLWVFPGAYLPFTLSRRVRKRAPSPPWRNVVILGWTGMRGGVSLAAALAIPTSFPGKDLITFLTFCVILATLLIQGLSLPALIRGLRARDDGSEEHEETKARFKVARAALMRLDELAKEPWVQADHVDDLRTHYSEQSNRFSARFHHTEEDEGQEERAVAYTRLKREIIGAERDILLDLRGRSIISDEVMRRVQHDLDLEEVGLPSSLFFSRYTLTLHTSNACFSAAIGSPCGTNSCPR